MFWICDLITQYLGDNIMYYSELGSKRLIVAKVEEIISGTEAKVLIYQKKVDANKTMYVLPQEKVLATIDRKLVHKVGFKFTKKGNLPKKVINALSLYEL